MLPLGWSTSTVTCIARLLCLYRYWLAMRMRSCRSYSRLCLYMHAWFCVCFWRDAATSTSTHTLSNWKQVHVSLACVVLSCLSLPCPVLSISDLLHQLCRQDSLSRNSHTLIFSGIAFQSISLCEPSFAIPFLSFCRRLLVSFVIPVLVVCDVSRPLPLVHQRKWPLSSSIFCCVFPENSGFPAIVLLRARSRDFAALCAYSTRRATIAHQ